jgi:hypothetical protein
MRKYLALFFVLIAIPVLAQQQPDPAFIQQAMAAIQGQRNAALDAAAACQAQAAMEIAKLKERIADLEKPK